MADLLVFFMCGMLFCLFACSGSQTNIINFVSEETNWFEAYSSCYLKMRGKFISLKDAEIQLYNTSLLQKIHSSEKKLWDPNVTLRTKMIITRGCFKVENVTELLSNRSSVKSLEHNTLTLCYHQCMYNTSAMPVAIAMQNSTCLCLTTLPNYTSMDKGQCNIHCPGDRYDYCGGHESIFSLYEIDNSEYTQKLQSSNAGCGYVTEERSQALSVGNCGHIKWFYCTKSSEDYTYVSISGDTWDNSREQYQGHLAHIDEITNVYRNDVEPNYKDGFWVGHRIWSYYYQYTGTSPEPNVTAITDCRYTDSASNDASFGSCLNNYSYLCLQLSSSISTSLSPQPSQGRPFVTEDGGRSKDTTPFQRPNGVPKSPSKSYGLIIGLIGAIAAVLTIMIFVFVRERRTKYDITYQNEEHHEMEIIATQEDRINRNRVSKSDSCNSAMNLCDGTEHDLHTDISKTEQSSNIYHTKRNCEQNSDYDHALLNTCTSQTEESCNIYHTNRNCEQNSDYDHALLNTHTYQAGESSKIFHTNRNCEQNDYYDHVKQNMDMTSTRENSNNYHIGNCVQNNAYDQIQTSSDE